MEVHLVGGWPRRARLGPCRPSLGPRRTEHPPRPHRLPRRPDCWPATVRRRSVAASRARRAPWPWQVLPQPPLLGCIRSSTRRRPGAAASTITTLRSLWSISILKTARLLVTHWPPLQQPPPPPQRPLVRRPFLSTRSTAAWMTWTSSRASRNSSAKRRG